MAAEVPIILDRARNLRLNLNPLTDAIQEAGSEAVEGFFSGKLAGIAALPAMRALLWASLKWEDKHMTIAKAGDLIEAEFVKSRNFLLIETKLIEAVVASGLFQAREKEPGAPGNASPEAASPPTSGTGSETQKEPATAPSV